MLDLTASTVVFLPSLWCARYVPAYAVCSQSSQVLCLGWADTQRLGDARSDGGMSVLAKNGGPQLLAECRRRCPRAEWPFWLPRSSRDGPPSRVPMPGIYQVRICLGRPG